MKRHPELTHEEQSILDQMAEDVAEAVVKARRRLAALGWVDGLHPRRKRQQSAVH